MTGTLTIEPLANEFFDMPIAHRGFHDCNGSFGSGRPENSYSAFKAAISQGYGIELDIQLSADSVPVVFHDNSLERLLKINKKISDLTLDSLKQFRLSNQEKIPTLDEFLELVDGQVPILIELKDQDGFFSHSTGRLETAVANSLKKYKGPAAVMSFNPFLIKEFSLKLPDIPRGLVTGSFKELDWPELDSKTLATLRCLKEVSKVSASFISHEYSDLGSMNIKRLPKKTKIFSWTIRDIDQLKLALQRSHNVTFEGFVP